MQTSATARSRRLVDLVFHVFVAIIEYQGGCLNLKMSTGYKSKVQVILVLQIIFHHAFRFKSAIHSFKLNTVKLWYVYVLF